MSTVARPMTTEEFLALPDDGMDRMLIRGELRERLMTVRNQWHSRVMLIIGHRLRTWLETQPEPRGDVYGGEVGCILLRNPDTTVGIDVAYFTRETLDNQSGSTTLIEGAPALAVEILSPSDTHEDITDKVRLYLQADTALVWIIDPDFRTVTVYRADREPESFNQQQQISADPFLPGFTLPVAQLFT